MKTCGFYLLRTGLVVFKSWGNRICHCKYFIWIIIVMLQLCCLSYKNHFILQVQRDVLGLQPIASILRFSLAPCCDQKCVSILNKYYNKLNLVSLLIGKVVFFCIAKLTITDHIQPRLTFSTSDTEGGPMHKTFQARMHWKHSSWA